MQWKLSKWPSLYVVIRAKFNKKLLKLNQLTTPSFQSVSFLTVHRYKIPSAIGHGRWNREGLKLKSEPEKLQMYLFNQLWPVDFFWISTSNWVLTWIYKLSIPYLKYLNKLFKIIVQESSTKTKAYFIFYWVRIKPVL